MAATAISNSGSPRLSSQEDAFGIAGAGSMNTAGDASALNTAGITFFFFDITDYYFSVFLGVFGTS